MSAETGLVELGSVTKWLSGGTPNRAVDHYWSGDIPWISASTLKEPEVSSSDQCVTKEAVASGSKMAPVNSTLLLVRGSALHTEIRAGLVVKPVCFNQDVKALIPNFNIHPKFLTYSILGREKQLLDLVSSAGNTAGVLDTKLLQAFKIWLPDVSEQRAIATALSDVDALIAGLEKLIAKKRDLKQAAIQQLLNGQTRLPGFCREWVEACLGDLARIQRGASPRPIESPVWFDDTSSVGWVRISDVTSAGMYLTETQQRLSPLGIQNSRPVDRGNLIMSICATVGRPVITEIDVCIHDGFVVFDKPQADKHFLYYVLKWIEPNWSKQGQTGSQMNLNTPLINGTKIMLPPSDEQKAIASALSEMDADLNAQESRLAKTRALKQGMMQELLTGRTRLV
jgi:type I restriction enzyme S subunit